jgi:hypothetical protein
MTDVERRHGGRTMTARARWYLTIASIRHGLTATFAIGVPASFASTSFYPIISAAPLWAWGGIFAGAALACGTGAVARSARVARLGLMWSATSTLMVGVGLLVSYFTGDLSSPTGPIIWLAVAGKDFTVCADPLRSPFEDWAAELADHLEDDGGESSTA